jgi:hypothetical protein
LIGPDWLKVRQRKQKVTLLGGEPEPITSESSKGAMMGLIHVPGMGKWTTLINGTL